MLIGSDGRARHMLVQTGQNNAQGTTDERILQLLRLGNRLLDAHPHSRQRALAWHAPVIVPVWVQVRLMEETPSYCTYHEAYEVNCTRYGREPDMPIVFFKQRCADARGMVSAASRGGACRAGGRRARGPCWGFRLRSNRRYRNRRKKAPSSRCCSWCLRNAHVIHIVPSVASVVYKSCYGTVDGCSPRLLPRPVPRWPPTPPAYRCGSRPSPTCARTS